MKQYSSMALSDICMNRLWRAAISLLSACIVNISPALAANVSHYYDAVGRLIETVGADGSSVQYSYDAVGNIVSVQRKVADALSVSGFVPASGDIGATVTVYGSAFDTVPSANSVRLGTTPITVVSASPTSFTFVVPVGATGGLISITNSKGTASSQSAFVVAATKAPGISGFSPAIGSPGTAVTVNGVNFNATPINNKVLFGQGVAGISSATTTSLLTAVPIGVRSGKITVSTPFGTAKSSDDFYATPPSVLPTDVALTSRIQLDGPGQNFSLPAGKKALYIFDGIAGRQASVGVAPVTPSGIVLPLSVFGANGISFGDGYASSAGSLHLHTVLQSDTHTLLVGSSSTALSGTIYLSSDIVDSVVPGGPAKVFTNSRPGQAGRYSFSAQAGQAAVFSITGSTFAGGGNLTLMRDFNASVATATFSSNSLRAAVLPATGLYTLILDPMAAGTGSIQIALQAADEQAVTVDGPVKSLALTGSKLAGSYSFDATAGDMIGAGFGNQITAPANSVIEYYFIAPNGTVLTSATFPSASTFAALAPTTGKYTVRVMPRAPATATVDLTVSKETISTITIDGPQASPASARLGQPARFNFDGTQGQRLTVAAINGTTSPANSVVTYSVLDPDGAVIFTTDTQTDFSTELPVLLKTGRYSIRAFPRNAALGTGSGVWLSSETATAISPNGTAFGFNATRPGQKARYTFSLSLGQNVLFSTISKTFSKDLNITLYAPDGSFAGSGTLGNASVIYQAARMAGTYTMFLSPSGASTGSISLSVNALSDVDGSIIPDGNSVAVNLGFGQRGNFSFNGTTGAKLHVGLNSTNITYSDPLPSRQLQFSIYKPDGTLLEARLFSVGDMAYDLPTLPTTGVYKVRIFGTGSIAYSIKGNLWVSTDLAGSISTDGTAKVFSSLRPGQNAAFTFTAPANTSYTLSLSANTFGGGQVRVVDASGTTYGIVGLCCATHPQDGTPLTPGGVMPRRL